jgi:hypothetical protein
VTQIESLSLGETLGSVINRQSRDESVTNDCPRTRRPNAAGADNPNSGHDSRTIQTHRPSHSTNRCGTDTRQRMALFQPESQTCSNQIWISATRTCSTVPDQIAEKSMKTNVPGPTPSAGAVPV